MKILKGLNKDTQPINVGEGFTLHAKNMIHDKDGSLSNEKGFDKKLDYPFKTYFVSDPEDPNPIAPPIQTIVGIIETSYGFSIVFSTYAVSGVTGVTKIDEIGRFDGTNYEVILTDGFGGFTVSNTFNFSVEAPISGVVRKNNTGDVIVSWRDKVNPPRILNIDTLPFNMADASRGLVAAAHNRTLIDMFPNIRMPQYSLESVNNYGGICVSGTYFFIIRYIYEDGSYTNWTHISKPVYLSNGSLTESNVHDSDGCEAKTPTGKSITLKLSNLDTNFPMFQLGVIERLGGDYRGYISNKYSRLGGLPASQETYDYTITYDGDSTKEPIDIGELTIDSAYFDRVQSITELQNRLHIGGVSVNPASVDFQKYANLITTKWVNEDTVAVDGLVSSHRNPEVTFNLKGFHSNEVYAFYIAGIRKNGSHTEAFHIPGRAPEHIDTQTASGRGDLYPTEDIEAFKEIDKASPVFRYRSTAKADGTMGYWENEDEFYPTTDDFDSSSLGGLDLRGEKVRHHRFPNMRDLNAWGGSLLKTSENYQTFFLTDAVYSHCTGTFTSDRHAYRLNLDAGSTTYSFGGLVPYLSVATPALHKLGFPFSVLGSPVWTDHESIPTVGFTYNFTHTGKVSVRVSFRVSVSYYGSADFKYWLLFKGEELEYKFGLGAGVGGGSNSGDWLTFSVDSTFLLDVEVGDKLEFVLALTADASITFEETTGGLTISDPIVDYKGDPLDGTLGVSPLAVSFGNIVIPEALRNEWQGYVIMYAKRDLNNSLVISESLVVQQSNNENGHIVDMQAKSWAFDSMYNKYPAIGRYVEPMYVQQGGSGVAPISYDSSIHFGEAYAPNSLIRSIEDLKYLPEDNSVVTPTNIEREECMTFKLKGNLHLSGGVYSTYPAPLTKPNYVCYLMSYRKNMYHSLNEQQLVSTGEIHYINSTDGIYTISKLYGGDTYLNIQSVAASNETSALYAAIRPMHFLVESNSNIDYRYEDISDVLDLHSYYPKSSYDVAYPKRSLNHYLYNKDYSALNDLFSTLPIQFTEKVYNFPHRVVRGVYAGAEDNTLNWRVFKPLDYYEMKKAKGVIVNIEAYGKQLLIHHEDTLYRTATNERIKTSTVDATLGDADIFSVEPIEIVPDTIGFAGTQSQHSCIVTKYGYIFLDEKRGRLFIFKESLLEYSAVNLHDWFRDNLERATVTEVDDNPYNDNGFTVVYDEHYNRLLITKNDLEGESFTLSFSMDTKTWTSFHDYTPKFMHRVGDKVYSHSEDGMYEHNSDTKKAIYYEHNQPTLEESLVPYESYVDVVFNGGTTQSKLFFAFTWVTEVLNEGGAYNHNDTITKAFLYNSYQASKEVDLTKLKNIRKEATYWSFNEFRDLVKDSVRKGNLPFIDEDLQLIPSAINEKKSSFRKRRFIDNYLVIRLYFNNLDNRTLFIHDVKSIFRLGQRGS